MMLATVVTTSLTMGMVSVIICTISLLSRSEFNSCELDGQGH